MQINHVKIINLLGISRLEFKAGKFVEFRGPNGSGKTSALESIKAHLRGGHDATILRTGSDKGESVLELDGGKSIRTRVTAAKTDRALLNESGRIEGGVTEIKGLVDALSVNPVEFVTASADRRAEIVLKAMPLKADPDRIKAITGNTVSSNINAHALDVIESVRKEIYDERTATNGAKKQAEAGKARAIATMPSVSESEYDEQALLQELGALESEKKKSADAISAKLSAILSKADADILEFRNQIDELKNRIREIEGKISEKNAFVSEQKSKANQKMVSESSAIEMKISDVKMKLRSISENRENATKLMIAKQQIEEAESEIAIMQSASEKYTKILEQLDDYKLELLHNLPIPGLEVKEGNVYFNGVPFDRVNTAEQIKIAVSIAKIMAEENARKNGNSLPIICVDRMECLDEQAYEVFKEEMIKSGCQTFVTRVGGDSFEIESTYGDE